MRSGKQAAYLAGLKQIEPGLVVNSDGAIRRTENICLNIQQGKDESTVISNAGQRLSGGNASIDKTQATQAVKLAKAHICTRSPGAPSAAAAVT